MAVYWHPFLAQMLRWDYGSLLEIRDEIPLGEMPPRLDLLLIRRDPEVILPFPFGYLGRTTLAEYKGPDDVADQGALVKLLGDALSFQRREQWWQREELTLWLIASNFTEDVSLPGGAEITGRYPVGPGVQQGTMDGFPVCLIDLNDVPLAPETLPLLMVSKGRQERALVEYLVDHAGNHPAYLQVLPLLHSETLAEVLTMRQMTPEEIGVEKERLLRLFKQTYSPGALLSSMDPEEAMQALIRAYGRERVQELLNRVDILSGPVPEGAVYPR